MVTRSLRLANVANWRFLVHGTSYADLFAAPSPLNHFWSLAIEEQFYLVFPVVVWLALKLPRRVRVPAVALVVSAALEWSAHEASVAGNFNRFYYGTDARMTELLVGVIAALALSYWRVSVPRPAGPQRLGRDDRRRCRARHRLLRGDHLPERRFDAISTAAPSSSRSPRPR